MKQEHTYTVYQKLGDWQHTLNAPDLEEAIAQARKATGSLRGTFGVFRTFENGTLGETVYFIKR